MKKNNKDFENIKVLIYGAGGKQALPMCKGFFQLGCKVTTYCGSKMDTGYLTKYKTKSILYNDIKQNNLGFYEAGVELIKSGEYDLVVPIGDEGATFLSKKKEDLSRYSKIAVNDWAVFQNIIDKSRTMKICNENNIPSPVTLVSDNPLQEIEQGIIDFPVVVKPKTGVGSIGFNIIHTKEALIKYWREYNNENGPLLIQEYIEQGSAPQYGIDVFRDRFGTIKMAIPCKVSRWYPIDGGSRLHSISIYDSQIIQSGIDLVNKLNYIGFANMDLVWDIKEQKAKILEVNGRTGASVKLDYLAGIDVAKLILQNELCDKVDDMMTFSENKEVSCFLVDLLWFIKSPTRFTTKPSWFNRVHISDLIFSWRDPLPSIGFIYTSLRYLSKALKKRKRFIE